MEIWNLNALCRCCHSDGSFKSLSEPYTHRNSVEIYSKMIQDTIGVKIIPPPCDASYSICDECIDRLRDVYNFKNQVVLCEQKFEEYCKNELATSTSTVAVKIEIEVKNEEIDVKDETETNDSNHNYDNDESFAGGDEKSLNDELKWDKTIIKTEKKPVTQKRKKINTKSEIKNYEKKGPKSKTKSKYDPSLEIHAVTDNGILYSCKICGGSYTEHEQIKSHILNIHCNTVYHCSECDKTFHTMKKRTEHFKEHKVYVCKQCGRSFSNKLSLKQHVNIHTKSIKYTCDMCAKEFSNKSTLLKHIYYHLGTQKKYMCDLCGKKFNDTSNLNIHIRTVHEKLRPFCCDLCPKRFSAKKHLIPHLRKHTGEKPFQCSICKKYFYTYWDSNNHTSCLKGETCFKGVNLPKIYKCKVCNKDFTDRSLYTKHIRSSHYDFKNITMYNTKSHKCDYCEKCFTSKYSKNRHELSHSGERKFKCNLCPLQFFNKGVLDRHQVRIHSNSDNSKGNFIQCLNCKRCVLNIDKHKLKCNGGSKFKCELCPRSFTRKTLLNKHLREIHNMCNFTCEYCNKKYSDKDILSRHKNRVHKVSLKTEKDDFN